MKLHPETTISLAEAAQSVVWAPDGRSLLAVPVDGPTLLWDVPGNCELAAFPSHGAGSGSPCFTADGTTILLPGFDGKIRLVSAADYRTTQTLELGRGWVEKVSPAPDGRAFAAACGKTLFVFNPDGSIRDQWSDHRTTVCDFAWNPTRSAELCSVADGGAQMWRTGESEPFTRFDWGGASLLVSWSPDGRWIVTGDQTPSVHIYDFTRDEPLHIQGYETKVRALSFNFSSRRLATGGSNQITVWDCTGKKGPEGTTPKQLKGHAGECLALAYHPGQNLLASGGAEGLVCLFEPEVSVSPLSLFKCPDAIAALQWSPSGDYLATACADGQVRIFRVTGNG